LVTRPQHRQRLCNSQISPYLTWWNELSGWQCSLLAMFHLGLAPGAACLNQLAAKITYSSAAPVTLGSEPDAGRSQPQDAGCSPSCGQWLISKGQGRGADLEKSAYKSSTTDSRLPGSKPAGSGPASAAEPHRTATGLTLYWLYQRGMGHEQCDRGIIQ